MVGVGYPRLAQSSSFGGRERRFDRRRGRDVADDADAFFSFAGLVDLQHGRVELGSRPRDQRDEVASRDELVR